MSNVVWVLGSGFSKPLGGPTLDDLFTDGWTERLKSRAKSAELARAISEAHEAYGHDLVQERRKPWYNPEEFFEIVENAASADVGTEEKELLKNHIGTEDSNTFLSYVRQYLASSTSYFVPRRSGYTERWSPYTRWARKVVGGAHQVITFNYDAVVESVCGSSITVPVTEHDGYEYAVNTCSKEGSQLIKLHGSVDWDPVPQGDGVNLHRLENHAELPHDMNRYPAIAPPGPFKTEGIHGALKPLWDRAYKTIRDARVLALVGYRFPETDADATKWIIDAIRGSQHDKFVYIVLGPDLNAPFTTRVKWLLHSALAPSRPVKFREGMYQDPMAELMHPSSRGHVIQTVPLYSQDFIALLEGV